MRTASEIDGLNHQAWELRGEDPHGAMALAAQARADSLSAGYPQGEAQSLLTLSHCAYRVGAYEQATSYGALALARYESLGDRAGQADALNTAGNIYAALGDYHTAFSLYLRSLTLRQEIGNRQAEAASWNNIGNVHFHLADFESALDAHQRSLALKEALGDPAGMAISLNNIGNVYQARGDLEGALPMYRRGLLIAQEIGNRYAQAGALSNLGAISAQLGNWPAALEHHLQSLAIEEEIGNRHGVAESLLQIGSLYLRAEGLPPAPIEQAIDDRPLHYLRRALELADALEAREISQRACQALAALYEQRGELADALAHFQRFHALERALFDERLAETSKRLQIIHQVASARRDAELQRSEAEVARLKTIELAAALADVDRQRQIAEDANRFKTRLLSVAAHDLRNPLSVISNYAELALMQSPESPQLRDLLVPIHLGARRMEQLIQALLESSVLESSQLRLDRQQIDLGLLAQAVVEMNQPRAQQKGQTLLASAEADCLVEVDEGRMWQALDNLVSNAIKFSPLGKRIWVSVSRSAGAIRCTVRDEGPGLTHEDLQRVFGRFERLSATPTDGEASIGLGLSIVRQLVDLHGGRAWAESAGAGRGSAFMIELAAASLIAPRTGGGRSTGDLGD
jgi:signal transduction histidine kinase